MFRLFHTTLNHCSYQYIMRNKEQWNTHKRVKRLHQIRFASYIWDLFHQPTHVKFRFGPYIQIFGGVWECWCDSRWFSAWIPNRYRRNTDSCAWCFAFIRSFDLDTSTELFGEIKLPEALRKEDLPDTKINQIDASLTPWYIEEISASVRPNL